LDNLAIALCLCIGSAVAWLLAIYSERGAYQLIANVAFGIVGTALCALAIAWIDPTLVVPALVMAGPLCAILMIVVGQATSRAVSLFWTSKVGKQDSGLPRS
jgi:hypothetical protein